MESATMKYHDEIRKKLFELIKQEIITNDFTKDSNEWSYNNFVNSIMTYLSTTFRPLVKRKKYRVFNIIDHLRKFPKRSLNNLIFKTREFLINNPDKIRELSPRMQKVLEMRYGLVDGFSHSLEEVSQEFGVTRERIRQIEAKALDMIDIPEDL